MELLRLWSNLVGLARFAYRVQDFLDETISIDQAERVIADGVRRREERFLEKLRLAVYPNPNSPYRKLLHAAGCEFGDVQRIVGQEGLEAALRKLAEDGVYVSYEEFKCQKPTIRGGQTFYFRENDFDDPRLVPDVRGASGGTRGKPMRVAGTLDQLAQMAPHWAVFFAENGCLDAPLIFWTPGHAGAAAPHLSCAKFNQKFVHWYVSEEMKNVKDRFYAACIHWLGRRVAGFPRPQQAPYSQPESILKSLLALLNEGKKPCVNTVPSAAVKLSLAAQNRGETLSGVTFLLGAEPLTPARRRTIEASGARATPLYGASEAGWIGGQCRCNRQPDEVHVLLDNYAVIPAREGVPGKNREGQSLFLTSLRRITPKILLNTDIGDRAVVERRRCDCLYDGLGCRLCLHTIRSSDKITEFGVNFAVSDVFHVLEEILPRRFGGAPGDFQLVESRDSRGLPRYLLLVNPGIPGIDEQTLPVAFLSELGKLRSYYGFMVSIWAREKVIRVRRTAPVATPRGKILPFLRANETSSTIPGE